MSADPQTLSSTGSRTSSTSGLFFLGMAMYMTGIVLAGFWPSYFADLIAGNEISGIGVVENSRVINVHAAVYVGWMLLLVTQTALTARGRTRTHMRVGWYGMVFGTIVIAVGLGITIVEMQNYFSEGIRTWGGLVAETWPSIETLTQFILLLALAYVYRTRPEAHKRYILFGTLALLFAATDRMFYLLGPWCAEIMLALTAGPILAYDLWMERRIHPASLIGLAVLLPHFVLRATVGH